MGLVRLFFGLLHFKEEVMEIQKAVLTITEAVAFTGLSKSYIYKLIHLRKIPCYKPLGGRVFFKQIELEEFLFKNRQAADYEAKQPQGAA